ncbi:MAG: phosphoribosylanthranilate isomerase [Betaproteobacteria bacterium]|nr:phosphoribosylanthranilate isomerase [Betaproteobacteria bacterium]
MESPPVTQARTRIKICGITRPQDALAAAAAGADAVGFVFYRPSPRHVAPDAAAAIARALPPFVTTVGLFVDAPADEVRAALAAVPLGLLQFHGDEPPDFCGQFGRPYIKAVRIRPETDLLQYAARYPDAAALLLDAFRPGVPGGTGELFDWDLIPAEFGARIVLSGGLTPGNVGAGIERVRPWAVDVSSGVEAGSGIKDAQRIGRFAAAVRAADGQLAEGGQPARVPPRNALPGRSGGVR